MNTTYNGYTNYSTWHVALMIDNEYGPYMQLVEKRQAGEDVTAQDVKDAFAMVPRSLWEECEETDTGCVNWTEIATGWNEEDYS